MQQGVTHFWRTAGIKHFHLIDTLILQETVKELTELSEKFETN